MKPLFILLLLVAQLNAAVVTRYFSTAAAGAGDGTTWADRAQLINAGTWSTVITGFNFASTDSMLAYVGPGTHTVTTSFASGLFANPPTVANPLVFHGCDSSGNPLTAPDPEWTADRPAFDSSGFPVLACTTNIATVNLSSVHWKFFAFTSSGRTSSGGAVGGAGLLNWVVVTNSTNDIDTSGVGTIEKATNVVVNMTGASYDYGMPIGTASMVDNIRVIGNAGSSGNRDGVVMTATTTQGSASRVISIGNGGHGFTSTSTNTSQRFSLRKCMAIGNAGDGFRFASTASQTTTSFMVNCVATGNAAYGLNGQSAANIHVTDSRFRDNTSGNYNGLGNWPTNLGNYTTDSDDATDYRNSASGDYQIANDSDIVGLNYGISEQPAVGGTLPTVAY